MKRSEVLEAAKKCVCEDRDKQYGSPEDSFAKIAELWSAYRGEYFPTRDVAMMMTLVKIARIYAGESIDSFVDLAGYAACGGELATEEKREKPEYTRLSKAAGCVFGSMGHNAPMERFYFQDGDKWVGLDNSTGDYWMEDFETEEECVAWLCGEKEIEDKTREEKAE